VGVHSISFINIVAAYSLHSIYVVWLRPLGLHQNHSYRKSVYWNYKIFWYIMPSAWRIDLLMVWKFLAKMCSQFLYDRYSHQQMCKWDLVSVCRISCDWIPSWKILLDFYFILHNCCVMFFKSFLLKIRREAYSFICSLIVPVCKVSCHPLLDISLISKGITVTWINRKFWPFLNIVISKATVHTPCSSCMWWGCPTLTHILYCCSKLCDTLGLPSVIYTITSPISV
jgi:hypothetical protein